MALKTFVKVSSVNNLSDARYCAGMEVNLIGFNLEEDNKNYISPDNQKELAEWLSGVQYVGEFENYSAEKVQSTIENYSLDYIQVEAISDIETLSTLGMPIILKIDITKLDHLQKDLPIAYLLVTSEDDQIDDGQMDAIKNSSASYKILLGFGIDHQNVETVLSMTQVAGIALQGGDELRPGYKDYDELADILETLEVEDY